MILLVYSIPLLLILLFLAFLFKKLQQIKQFQNQIPDLLEQTLNEKHRSMLNDLHSGLNGQAESHNAALAQHSALLHDTITQSNERLKDSIALLSTALRDTMHHASTDMRDTMGGFQTAQSTAISTLRVTVCEGLAQTRELLAKQLSETVTARLDAISHTVSERLDEGFKKTNETFSNVMARLATIDEAQKKIDGLTTNVVSLQELLGDKKSRGAFGEVQLTHLLRNALPPHVFELQATLSNGARADCILRLPPPSGNIVIDAKFPLENYRRMFDNTSDRATAVRAFKSDVKKHIDAIAEKYILCNETAAGAVMFIPAEAIFAEIHAYHPELIQHAMNRCVWIVSPTTLMAVLNTARAVIKDVETQQQIHIIKEALSYLAEDFRRFDERMKKLATHIRQAHDDMQGVTITSEKISRRFTTIEQVNLEHPAERPLMQ